MKKIHKIAFLKIVGSIVLAVFTVKAADFCMKAVGDKPPSDTIRYCVGVVGFVALLFAFFSEDRGDLKIAHLEQIRTLFSKPPDFRDKPEPIVVPKKGELKWSSLMGPVTRERALEIISTKKRGGRMPTLEELRDGAKSPYFGSRYIAHYWVREENMVVDRNRGCLQKCDSKDLKAHFVIVWDV